MPLNPNIILQQERPNMARPVAPVDPVKAQIDAMTLRKLQQQEQDEQTKRQVLAQGGGVRERTLAAIQQNPQAAHLLPELTKAFDEADAAAERVRKAKFDTEQAELGYFGHLAAQVQAAKYDPGILNLALQHAEENGHDTAPIRQLIEQRPDQVQAVVDGIMARAGIKPERVTPEAVKTREITRTLPDGSTVIDIVEDKPGQSFTSAGPAAKSTSVSDFDYFVRKAYGPNPTPAQILAARKAYNQSDDRPAVTVRMGNGMTPSQSFQAERSLRNDFDRETKAAQTVQQQLALMESSLKAVKEGRSPAGSQGVLVTFQKILDPTSVVRESEYERSGSGLSLLGRIQGQWDKIQQGGAGVPVKDLEDFVALARSFAQNQAAFARQTKKQIDATASEYGLDPTRITKEIGGSETGSNSQMGTQTGVGTAPQSGGVLTYEDYKRSRRAK